MNSEYLILPIETIAKCLIVLARDAIYLHFTTLTESERLPFLTGWDVQVDDVSLFEYENKRAPPNRALFPSTFKVSRKNVGSLTFFSVSGPFGEFAVHSIVVCTWQWRSTWQN